MVVLFLFRGDNMQEIWKDIKGYEGIYQISNLGKIKSLDRKDYANRNLKGVMLKFGLCKGYYTVVLSKCGEQKQFRVNRLVAENFIKNLNNYSDVNHIDENKINNRVDNLEWCTRKYNNSYGTRLKRISKKSSVSLSKKVYQYDKELNLIKEWLGTREIERNTGYRCQNISACCLGQQKTCGGYIWSYGKIRR